MLYEPVYDDQADYLANLALREYLEAQMDQWWFDNVARFNHFQLRPMRRKGIFF